MPLSSRNNFNPGGSLAFFSPPGGSPTMPDAGFNLNPQPQSGTNAFGMVPGNLSLPPAFGGVNQPQVASVINSQLNGELSPAEQAAIQDAGARFGVSSGMPGSGLARNRTVRDFGIATGQRQNQGIQNFNSLVPGAAYQTGVQEQNAVNAASPNPAAAASYAQQLFDRYLQSMRGPGGGTRGSYGSPAGSTAQPSTGAAGFPNPTPQTAYDSGHGLGPWYGGDQPTHYMEPGAVPWDYAGDPMDLVPQFSTPGDVPYFWDVDPSLNVPEG